MLKKKFVLEFSFTADKLKNVDDEDINELLIGVNLTERIDFKCALKKWKHELTNSYKAESNKNNSLLPLNSTPTLIGSDSCVGSYFYRQILYEKKKQLINFICVYLYI